jgi:hypothetical protein
MVSISVPKSLTDCARFFQVPSSPKHRSYEALRAFFLEHRPSAEVARSFGYSAGSFRVLCHQFRRDPDPEFFVSPKRGPRSQPFKNAACDTIVGLRKRNYSIYEISEALKACNTPLSPTGVREVLKEAGFAALPRRLDEERPDRPRPTREIVADVRAFRLTPGRFRTRCGGLFLFVPALVQLRVHTLATEAGLPGSKMIPPSHALLASLATKLWSIDRKSHVMSLAADPGLALFSGLPATPKRSFLSEYSCRVHHAKTMRLLSRWHHHLAGEELFDGSSFNLDFHSVPFFGEHPSVEPHYVAMRSRRQPSVLTFIAHDAESRAFCYANADLRKGDENDEIFRFIKFWKANHGELPRHLVFDSKLTTYANLARLAKMGITFITLRRRTRKLLAEVSALPPSAWRTVTLEVPTRKYKTPRVFEQSIVLAGAKLRQLFVQDLGHDQPTILLTNDTSTASKLIARYAQRMLIENALSDAVRFFHMDALSSSVGLKVDFDMTLLVIASTLYRLLARDMRGYDQAQARQIFRDLIDMPADIVVKDNDVTVEFHRRAHLPILLASNLFNQSVAVPWWNGAKLTLSTHSGSSSR